MTDQSLLAKLEQCRKRLPVFGPVLLYWLPLPLLPAVFIALARGNFVNFATALGALVLLLAAAWSTRRGMKRDVEVERLGWSRIAPVPWKLLGAVASGLATTACSLFIIKHSDAASAAVGVTTLVGVLLSYDIDGLFYRWAKGRSFSTRDREVTEALQEARIRIDKIDMANRQIHNPEFRRRIRRIIRQAVDILTTIAEDPATLRQARKFLKVYLDGAQRVTEAYSQVYHVDHKGKLEDNFREMLITIEDTFSQQQQKMQEKDLMDLDIQIEVLTTQLKNEGVL